MIQKLKQRSYLRFGALFWKPLGSHFLQNWRLKSQMLILFDFFCHLPGLIVSCCARDASKTQTALVSAISGRWSRPWSLVTPPVGVTPPGCWSRPRVLVTPPVAGHAPQKGRTSLTTQSPHHPRTRYIQLAASNSLRPTRCVVFPSPAWRNARSD